MPGPDDNPDHHDDHTGQPDADLAPPPGDDFVDSTTLDESTEPGGELPTEDEFREEGGGDDVEAVEMIQEWDALCIISHRRGRRSATGDNSLTSLPDTLNRLCYEGWNIEGVFAMKAGAWRVVAWRWVPRDQHPHHRVVTADLGPVKD